MRTGGARAGTFVFITGADRITDFNSGLDRLSLGSDLWNGRLMRSDVLFLHATVVGGDTVLDFSGGNRLTLDYISDWVMLAAQIDYI